MQCLMYSNILYVIRTIFEIVFTKTQKLKDENKIYKRKNK